MDHDTDDFEYLQSLLLCVDADGCDFPPTQAEADAATDLCS